MIESLFYVLAKCIVFPARNLNWRLRPTALASKLTDDELDEVVQLYILSN